MIYFRRPTRSPRMRSSSSGFSLIEALIAMAIFAFMMMGTMPLFIKSITDTSRNRNQFHFNGDAQAIMDELTARKTMSPVVADVMLAAGAHAFSNAATYVPNTNTPNTVVNMFLGSLSNPNDRIIQNTHLGQVQYQVTVESSRTRVDLQIFYFIRTQFSRTMAGLCAGAASVNTPIIASCDPAAPPARMAVMRMTSYIDSPMQRPPPL